MSTPTILCIEDNPMTQKILKATIESKGYHFLGVASGNEAFQILTTSTPDLVLLDWFLPDMMGMDIFSRIRNMPCGATVPIICMTGFLSPDDERKMLDIGFQGLLIKPIAPLRLLKEIESLLFEKQSDISTAKKHILLVDDDIVQLKLVRTQLEIAGFSLSTAKNGVEALDQLDSNTPDLIISDVLMPKMDGFQLCRELREKARYGHIPIILLSNDYITDEDRTFARTIGAYDFVFRLPNSSGLIQLVIDALNTPSERIIIEQEEYNQEHKNRLGYQVERLSAIKDELEKRCTLQGATLSVIGVVTETLSSQSKIESKLETILSQCLDIAGLSMGAIYLKNEANELQIKAQIGVDSSSLPTLDALISNTVIGNLVENRGAPLAISSADINRFIDKQAQNRGDINSIIVAPINSSNANLGLLIVFSHFNDLSSQDWTTFGSTIATGLGQSIALERSIKDIKKSLLEKEILLKEIHHRVKNNLQVIVSLLNIQSQFVKDPRDLNIFKDCQSRVYSMSLIHQKLYQSENLSRINFGDYIRDLSLQLTRSYNVSSEDILVKISTQEYSLDLDLAVPLGLIINELLSNAFKYAFPTNRKGSVEICLNTLEQDKLSLVVADNGIGLPPGFAIEKSNSLGLQIVQDLSRQINGQLEIGNTPTGTNFKLTFPSK